MKKDLRAQLQAKADRLRPLEELAKGKGFLQWRAHIEKELEKLEDYSWNMASPSDSANIESALAELGLIAPTKVEDLLSCFLGFRAARNYMRAKLNWLDKQARDFHKVQEQLAKRED